MLCRGRGVYASIGSVTLTEQLHVQSYQAYVLEGGCTTGIAAAQVSVFEQTSHLFLLPSDYEINSANKHQNL